MHLILSTAVACLTVIGTSIPYLWVDFFNLVIIEAKILSLFSVPTKLPSIPTKVFYDVFELM